MSQRMALLLVTAAVVFAPTVMAQSAPTPSAPTRHVVVSFGFGPAGNPITPKPNAPFSAVLTSHIEQTLSDGTTISRENQETVTRDSMGRIYRARTIKRPESDARRDGGELATIMDPKRHIEYVCTPLKVCRTVEYRDPSGLRRPPGLDASQSKSATVEDLGSTEMAGVQVEGKRTTRVIPEGTIGNDRPFTTVEEIWHSKDLDLDIQVIHSDPRAGTRTNTVSDLVLGEPDAKYFQIPAGYRIEPMGHLAPQPYPLAPFPQGGETSSQTTTPQ